MANRQSIPHFSDFSALMEEHVLPHLNTNPEFERLDGLSSKGNRAVFATFNHLGHKWKIAMDTKSDRLRLAWALFKAGKEPFFESNTGSRKCLRLNDGGSGEANGVYVYEMK